MQASEAQKDNAGSKGLGILASARYSVVKNADNGQGGKEGAQGDNRLIVFIIGGISHQEITVVNQFERNQIIHGKWHNERLVLGSTNEKVLTGNTMLDMLGKVNSDDNLAGFR